MIIEKPSTKLKPIVRMSLFILISIIAIVSLVWSVSQGLAIYHYILGRQLIDRVLTISESTTVVNYCNLQLTDNSSLNQIKLAGNHLEKVLEHRLHHSNTYILLGRTYCMLGQINKAVSSYAAYTQHDPSDSIGHLELGFAYETYCRENERISQESLNNAIGYQFCQDSKKQELIKEEWDKAGALIERFISEGNIAFARQEYYKASQWYERWAFLKSTPTSSMEFQWVVSSILSGSQIPSTKLSDAIIIHNISENTIIEAEELQWMKEASRWNLNYGDKLSDHPNNNPEVAVMWWDGAAIALLQVPEQAIYHITIRIQDTPPGPIKIQIERDTIPIDRFILTKGDLIWHELETSTIIPSGLHIIGINYLENNGDAIIDWIRFKKISL
jgi:tetratricopeptide (TPR) repeat protein